VLMAACIGLKRPVGHAANVELLVAGEEEFAPHVRPDEHRDAGRRARAENVRGDRLSDRRVSRGHSGWRRDRHDGPYTGAREFCPGVTVTEDRQRALMAPAPGNRGTTRGCAPGSPYILRASSLRLQPLRYQLVFIHEDRTAHQ